MGMIDMATPSAPPPGEESDDELPTSSVAELTTVASAAATPPAPAPSPDDSASDRDSDDDDALRNEDAALRRARLAVHSKLRAYEAKRRAAYESKLQSSSLYWHAFRTLMHDSLLETQRADVLARGWTHASEAYGTAMRSVGEWQVDGRGVPVADKKRNAHDKRGGPVSLGEYLREERCGSMIERLAGSAGGVAEQYEEMGRYMHDEVLPQLSELLEHLRSEILFTEKLGDSIMNELETAEDEVCRAWESYYNTELDYSGASSEAVEERHGGVQDVATPENAAVIGCADVWVEEMRYRMAVAFLSSVWEKCSSELSKLFLSMKDAECNRRNQIKDLLIKATQRQETLWLELPAAVSPILKDLTEWPMERKLVEDDVQYSIRERAQAIQRDEAERKKSDEPQPTAPGLTGVDEGDGNFELSSPLVSDLMCKAKVMEKRSPGMLGTWKVSLAVITSDSFLQLFELPPSCKLHPGSAPEVAFQNLIPPVVVPSMESVKGGVKFPSSKNWFDYLTPSESFALRNCIVSQRDEKAPTTFEIVETMLTSGASKMFTKTTNRKMQFRAITREEARDFVDALKRSRST